MSDDDKREYTARRTTDGHTTEVIRITLPGRKTRLGWWEQLSNELNCGEYLTRTTPNQFWHCKDCGEVIASYDLYELSDTIPF